MESTKKIPKNQLQTPTKQDIGLGNVDNTSDADKPISTAVQSALDGKQSISEKNQPEGYAGLDANGKIESSRLPTIAVTDTFVVASESAMLALTAETGDVAVRTDLSKSFILKGTNASVLTNWQELLSPTSPVSSVHGRTGAVTANTGDYTTAQVTETTNKNYQTDNQKTFNDATSSIQTQLNSKENTSNKSTNVVNDGASDVKFPSVKAVKTYVDAQVASATIVDASTTVKGKIKLAGDLGGTADLPTVPALENKVDKVTGKGLSTEDYTTAEKNKLANLATVATSGSYDDLSDKPTIPSISGLATETYVDSKIENTIVDGVTTKAPSQNAVFDALATKVDKVAGKGLSTEDYTTAEKNKLAGIQPGAEVNVNADWNATSGDAQILNKPSIPASQVNSDWNASSGVAQILNKPTIPAAQIQSDWNQSNNTSADFIKNKPTIPSIAGSVEVIPKFTSPNTIGDSAIFDTGDFVGILLDTKIQGALVVKKDANINKLTVGQGNNPGQGNTVFGINALASTNNGKLNIAIGYEANRDNDVSGLTAIGIQSNVDTNLQPLPGDCLVITQFNSNAHTNQVPHIYAPPPIDVPANAFTDVIAFDPNHYAGAIIEYIIRLNDGGDYAVGDIYTGWKSSGSGTINDNRRTQFINMSGFVFSLGSGVNGAPTIKLQNTTANNAWIRITVRGLMNN